MKSRLATCYFALILLISWSVTLAGDRTTDAFGAAIFLLFTFPVFGIVLAISNAQFRDAFEERMPDVYKQKAIQLGVREYVTWSDSYKALKDSGATDLLEQLRFSKFIFRLWIASFILVIFQGVCLMVFKR